MADNGISGLAVAVATAGGLLVYAGFRGVSPLQALRDVSTGHPAGVRDTPASFTEAAPTQSSQGASGFGPNGGALLAEMQRIGTGKSYSQLKRTGPASFDCSGLVWRAGANLGYWGPGTGKYETAFTTATFAAGAAKAGLQLRPGLLPSIQPGDICLWSGHMGVAVDATHLFSAMSSHTTPNIGVATLAAINKEHPWVGAYYFTGEAQAGQGGSGGGGGSW